MTITARIVKAVVTLPILGTVSRNDKGEVVRSGERYRIHLYAAKPGMKYDSQTHTHLLVGVLDGGGYTTEPTKRSEDFLLPDGRELIALRVYDYGIPLSWESLPVEVMSEYYPNGGFALNREGQVFINSAFIDSGNHNTYKINVGLNTKSTEEKVREIVLKYLTGEATEYADELVGELNSLFKAESDCSRLAAIINQHMRQQIKREFRPGGLLHGR